MLRADEFLKPQEKADILKAKAQLAEAYRGNDHSLIRQKMAELDDATLHLAQGIMDSTIADALKDKTIDQLEEQAEKTTHK